MKILIAEDEAPQRDELVRLLTAACPDAELLPAEDGLAALEVDEAHQPDVAFLDLRMPGIGGLEVAKRLTRALVVFVTAYDDAAVEAFEAGAIDYLLKPIHPDRLQKTISRLEDRSWTKQRPALEALSLTTPAPLRWITASLGDVVRLYPIDDVVAFQSQDKYTRVITRTDEALIRKSLRELSRALDPELFWQVHRSTIVRGLAIDAVKRGSDGRCSLTLKGRDGVFPVSTAFQRSLRGM